MKRQHHLAPLLVVAVASAAFCNCPQSWAAESTFRDKAERPRFTMAHGQGWGVCESYLKFLNSMPIKEGPPLCDLKLRHVRGMKEPEWEVVTLQQNLKLVHQIELILGRGRIDPEPDRDFERWRLQFEQRIRQGMQPRLRRVQFRLVPQGYYEIGKAEGRGPIQVPKGNLETLFAYDLDLTKCGKEVHKANQGQLDVLGQDQPNLFVFDNETQRVMGSASYALRLQGELWLFDGKPYQIEHPILGRAGGTSLFRGDIAMKRAEPTVSSLPGDPPYVDRELCRISFEYHSLPSRNRR